MTALPPDTRETPAPARTLGRNVLALSLVSLLTDASSEMIYPLLPIFLQVVIGASASSVGTIEGAAESTAALLKLASGWWSDRVKRRKPLVVAGYALASAVRPLVAIAASPAHVLLVRLVDRVGKGIRSSPRDALLAESVHPSVRGRAFGFHRAADHAGAVIGPLVAFALMQLGGLEMRTVFWLAAVPAAGAMLALVLGVREEPAKAPAGPPDAVADGAPPREQHDDFPVPPPQHFHPPGTASAAGRRAFPTFLAAVTLFTLGNSSDAFLLLRARQLGVPVALVPVLWSAFHVVKSASSTPGGALSDRYGRKPLIVAGWLLYAVVYFAFGRAETAWQAWALFGVYGLFFGLTEGSEKAFVADLVPRERVGTAFGWYNLAVGLAALPASLLFGALWDRIGPPAAFTVGALLALGAAVMVLAVPAGDPR